MVVPSKSIVIEKGGAYIFVVRPDSIAERRLIELGPEVNNRVIVERGVVPGEKIVVEGFHKLNHGDARRGGRVPGATTGRRRLKNSEP